VSDPISVGLLVLRVGLGVVFLAHGLKHLAGREKTTRWFASIGFKAPGFQWFASTSTELGVGALLIAGLLTGPAAAGVFAVMFVAFWTVHRFAGFWITAFMRDGVDVEGYEYVGTLSLIGVTLAITGAGEYAMDAVVEVDGTALGALLDGWVGIALVAGAVALAAAQIAVFWRPSSSS
jgi:putative oxidoreductase